MHNKVVVDGELNLTIPVDGETGVFMAVRQSYPIYTGETVVTPSEQSVVLDTALKTTLENITVNPIPPNYGRIAWDGSRLTVY